MPNVNMDKYILENIHTQKLGPSKKILLYPKSVVILKSFPYSYDNVIAVFCDIAVVLGILILSNDFR